jgi:hypothetical protein
VEVLQRLLQLLLIIQPANNHETTITTEKNARTISWAKHLQQQHADSLQ